MTTYYNDDIYATKMWSKRIMNSIKSAVDRFGIDKPICALCNKPVEHFEQYEDDFQYLMVYKAICHGRSEHFSIPLHVFQQYGPDDFTFLRKRLSIMFRSDKAQMEAPEKRLKHEIRRHILDNIDPNVLMRMTSTEVEEAIQKLSDSFRNAAISADEATGAFNSLAHQLNSEPFVKPTKKHRRKLDI